MFNTMIEWMDRGMEGRIRSAAQTLGRRNFLARVGSLLVGGTLLPMLPFDRSIGVASAAEGVADETSCDYWAYCSLDGYRCNACGGSATQCPPGSQASTVAWIGSCNNPMDKKAYLVAYNDCCGKSSCDIPDASCSRNEGERPGYKIGAYNDANWCMANTNKGIHCSIAIIVGPADSE
jgi:methylamine dehydrogenase light chain